MFSYWYIVYYAKFLNMGRSFIIGNPISDRIADYNVTIWNVVFANKSRKLGWIWMKLGRWG